MNLEQFKRDLRDEELGIKSFCRPSAWLEDLFNKDEDEEEEVEE